MLKLKKNVVEFLKTFVKPEKLDEVKLALERAIQAELKDGMKDFNYVFNKEQSFRPITMAFTLDDFQEELVPYKWYPREMWDENPQGYLVTQALDKGSCKKYGISPYDFGVHPVALWKDATHFMFIEPLEVEDDAS